MSEAYLAVADGSVYRARCRAPGTARGELVFTTAYTGYEESLTDPSYEEQVLTFSYPLIGNYGVRAERFESDRVHPRAAVAREFTDEVAAWLASAGVPALDHIETRELVTSVRENGAMRCGVAAGEDASPGDATAELEACRPMSAHADIGERVTTPERTVHRGDDIADVALLDCGAKASIVDSLTDRGADVHVLSCLTGVDEIRRLDPDLLFLSNGPGDPATFTNAQSLVETFVGEIPIAGICLGQQVVARAVGGDTEKMAFGHRGVNQPVRDLESGRVLITTQNHGYTVSDPGDLTVTQRNVNDGTAEGLADHERDVCTRQYHPEANPGPHDARDFFDEVLTMAAPESTVTAD